MNSITKSLVGLLLIGVVAAGCKKDSSNNDTPTGPGTTGGATSTFVGTIANGTESGKVSLSGTLGKTDGAVTGTLTLVKPSAATITLNGTFVGVDTAAVLTVSGGGYSFVGGLAQGFVYGSYTGPHGTGTFMLNMGAANASPQVYVGTYTSQAGHTGGTFNLTMNGSTVSGLAIETGQTQGIILVGNYTGSSINLFEYDNATVSVATGTISGTTVSGTYNNHVDDHGTWTGTLVQ